MLKKIWRKKNVTMFLNEISFNHVFKNSTVFINCRNKRKEFSIMLIRFNGNKTCFSSNYRLCNLSQTKSDRYVGRGGKTRLTISWKGKRKHKKYTKRQ